MAGRTEHRDRVAGAEHLGLVEMLTALHVDVEQMRFAVAGAQLAVPGEYERSVVELAVLLFRERAADQRQIGVLRHAGQLGKDMPAHRFRECRKILVGVRTAEHLGQHSDARAFFTRMQHELPCFLQVLFLIHADFHLDESDFHGVILLFYAFFLYAPLFRNLPISMTTANTIRYQKFSIL